MTDDQLIVLNQNRRGFAGVAKGFGAQQNRRHTGIGFYHFGKGQRAVDRDARAHGQVVITQALHARGQPFCCRRIASGGKRGGGYMLDTLEQTHRQMQRTKILLRAEEHVGKFVNASIFKACAVQHGVKHRITIDSAGGADFTQ